MSSYEQPPTEPTNEELAKKPFDPVAWLKSHIRLVGIIAGVVVLGLIVLSFFNWQRGVRAEGYEWQNNTLVKYMRVQTTLGTCLDNTMISAQIAQQERQSLKDTLTAVVQARYVDASGKTVDVATPQGQAIMIQVIQEAYPNVSPDLFKQLMTVAVGCRNEVSGAQQDLQAYAGRFQTWTKGGNVFDGAVREEFPNDELQVRGLNGTLAGKAALRFIVEPITTSEASESMQTKTMPQQTLFPSAEPTK